MSTSERDDQRERQSHLSGLMDKLREERDHLRVQYELGKMEAREEWQELEHKWDQLEQRMDRLEEEVEERIEEIGEELKSSYARLRDKLTD